MMLPRRPLGGAGEESMCAPMSRQRVKTEVRFTWMTWGFISIAVMISLSRLVLQRPRDQAGREKSSLRSNHCLEIRRLDAVAEFQHNSRESEFCVRP